MTPAGGGKVRSTSAKTTEEGVPADADPIKLEPGQYRLDEILPEGERGTWKLADVSCGGKDRKAAKAGLEIVIKPGEGETCTFTNEFTPAGELTITKETVGGVGTAGFVISKAGDPDVEYTQSATTKRENDPVEATGDSTKDIRLGSYVIQETEPHSTDGEWRLASVICNGEVTPAAEGRVEVKLTEKKPRAKCAFVNKFTPGGGPPPEPPGPDPIPGGPDPDLVVTKRANPGATVIRGRVDYTVTVRNRGARTAEGVTLIDQPETFEAIVAVQRPCRGSRLINCAIGNLPPGASKTFRFRSKVLAKPRRKQKNTAAVVSSTPETRLDNNRDSAGIRVFRDPCADTAFRSSVGGPLAQVAC